MEAVRDCRVYVHRRKTDGRIFYVGKGIGDRPFRRGGRNRYWHNVVNKHGYTVEIVLDWAPEQCCRAYEMALIYAIGRKNLCNMTDGGEGIRGLRHTEESRNLMSKHQKRLWENPEYRKSRTGPNHHCYGKSPSDEARRKLSIALKGRFFSEEHRRKIGMAHAGENNYFYGKTLSPEHKKKISEALAGEKHPLYGKPVSEERRQKMSLALKGKKLKPEHIAAISRAQTGKVNSPETRIKISEGVKKRTIYKFQHNDGREFVGIRFDFVAQHKVDPSALTKLINGELKTHHGWRVACD